MKSIASSRSFKKRVRELKKVSSRIDAKMVKMESIIANMLESLAEANESRIRTAAKRTISK